MRTPCFAPQLSTIDSEAPVALQEFFRRHQMHLLIAVMSVSVVFFWGCGSGQVTTEKARAMSTPGLGPEQIQPAPRLEGINVGDQVQLSVLGYPEFNTTATIRESGMFAIPLAGDVRVLGLSKEQLTEEIVKKLSEFVKTKVFANVTIISSPMAIGKIIVLGAVGSQGSFPAPAPISIFNLLASTGGLAPSADLRHIKVYRNADLSREMEIDLSGIISPGGHADIVNAMVNPGDMVYVPPTQNFIREFSPFVYDILVLLTLFRLVN